MDTQTIEGVGIIIEVYWAVPSQYTIGDIFPAADHAGAVACAKAKIKPIDYRTLAPQKDGTHFDWTRAQLDKRMKIKWIRQEDAGVASVTSGEDTIVNRVEIHLTKSEKEAKLREMGFID